MSQPAPWTREQVRAVIGVNLVGAAAIAFAFVAADRTRSLAHQVGWINLAILGLALTFLADGSLLLFSRRSVGRRRLSVLPDDVEHADAAVPTSGWVWLPGTQRVHRPGCELVTGKPARTVHVDDIRREGLALCEVCAC